MPADLEWRMWRQLRGAFGIDQFIFTPVNHKMEGYTFRQADNIREAVNVLPPDTQLCYLEPGGFKSMYDLPSAQDDVALILGSTDISNMHSEVVPPDAYGIQTFGNTDLYGINAAAIALAFMAGQ